MAGFIQNDDVILRQTISAATGTVDPRIDDCFVDYTTTGAVTDIELDADWITAKSKTTFYDVDGNAGTNNITIKNTANTIIAVICEDGGSVTCTSDGTNILLS